MAQSIKLKNENYIDSTGVVHNKQLLSDVIDNNGIVIAESKLASPSSTITVGGLNLQKDKHYKIEFYGASNVDGELYIRLNNINNLYNHIAIAANGTNTGNSNNNLVSV